ncbi:hypothetical protein [Pseudarthrobacter sp. NIBRBAC000502770]|uniref:hypothetical protein n=1 Tax=Pseudarthrobacter sp. NIBRBAC000502770 TaxID=2590785 RepID=UPI00113FF486|nr:hypothetical protein [Pseudarthrobacter sp. NIBRBAC000502770]QDG89098.1 hypothetical protein NIBR502770_11880 [Pseudarthrobacter sp. NIBRBAC000502770]
MGLRDEAEKINAERSAQEAVARADPLVAAKARVRGALKNWCASRGLYQTPDYVITDVSKRLQSYGDDYPIPCVSFSFEVEGIEFRAELWVRLVSHELLVRAPAAPGVRQVRGIQDVAAVIWEMENRGGKGSPPQT